jgi:hypothetical protein
MTLVYNGNSELYPLGLDGQLRLQYLLFSRFGASCSIDFDTIFRPNQELLRKVQQHISGRNRTSGPAILVEKIYDTLIQTHYL